MEANILLSKIVANPTESTWAQAYSTLNLYVVLSINKAEADEKGIVISGKELLERIQREYFSLDEKSLSNIKKSIEEACSDIADKKTISIALATIAGDTLFLVTVGESKIVLKRGEKIGVVAQGELDVISAFSGNIQGDDIIILETEAFSKKIPVQSLSSLLGNLEVTEISENLAPIIHNEPQGDEAAIILQYKKFQQETPTLADTSAEDGQEMNQEVEEKATFAEPSKPKLPKINIPHFALPVNLLSLGRKKFIIIAIVLLAVLLFGSIIIERGRQEKVKREAVLNEILVPAQERFDEANALIALNRGLALDEFTQLKDSLTGDVGKIEAETEERKKLDEFIGKVEGKIGELSVGASLANQKMIRESVNQIVFREGQLAAIGPEGKISLLDSAGKSTKEIDSENGTVRATTADDTAIFVLGSEGITRSTKAGVTKTIIEDPETTVAIDTFGANLYGLNTADKTVDKYSGSSYKRGDYFTEDVALVAPSRMSIDGSVWIVDAGKVRRFTRGKEVSFAIPESTKKIGSNAEIFTGVDYVNVYVLDPSNNRIIAISKDGEIKNQYTSGELKNATSLAVDESGSKIYVVISGKLYSFDL